MGGQVWRQGSTYFINTLVNINVMLDGCYLGMALDTNPVA